MMAGENTTIEPTGDTSFCQMPNMAGHERK
jgi:hypothetical protein